MRQWIDKLQEERTLQPEEFRQLLTECDGESLRYINKQAQESVSVISETGFLFAD